MVSKNTRVFTVDGETYRFDSNTFRMCCDSYCQIKKISKCELEEILSKKLNVSASAIHNWRFNKNGPSEIELIVQAAEALGIHNWKLLLKECAGGAKMTKLSVRQVEAAKRIFDACIWFLNEFYNSDGFSNYWYNFMIPESEKIHVGVEQEVGRKMGKVITVLEQEYFDLHDLEEYDVLCEYVSDTLTGIYDGKIGKDYNRYECDGTCLSTYDEYWQARKKLDNIVEKYF